MESQFSTTNLGRTITTSKSRNYVRFTAYLRHIPAYNPNMLSIYSSLVTRFMLSLNKSNDNNSLIYTHIDPLTGKRETKGFNVSFGICEKCSKCRIEVFQPSNPIIILNNFEKFKRIIKRCLTTAVRLALIKKKCTPEEYEKFHAQEMSDLDDFTIRVIETFC